MNCIYSKGLFIHLWIFFTLVSLLISRICKQFSPHHPSIEIVSGYSRVAFLCVLGNLWLCVNELENSSLLLWEVFSVPTWNLQLKEVSRAPGLQVHPAPRVLPLEWNEARETSGGEGMVTRQLWEIPQQRYTSVFHFTSQRGRRQMAPGWNAHQGNTNMEGTEWSNHLDKIAGTVILTSYYPLLNKKDAFCNIWTSWWITWSKTLSLFTLSVCAHLWELVYQPRSSAGSD